MKAGGGQGYTVVGSMLYFRPDTPLFFINSKYHRIVREKSFEGHSLLTCQGVYLLSLGCYKARLAFTAHNFILGQRYTREKESCTSLD